MKISTTLPTLAHRAFWRSPLLEVLLTRNQVAARCIAPDAAKRPSARSSDVALLSTLRVEDWAGLPVNPAKLQLIWSFGDTEKWKRPIGPGCHSLSGK
jgi:hypothetical protein